MKRLLTLIVTGLMSIPATATNWVIVAYDDNTNVYVDIDSISTIDNVTSAFSKLELSQTDFLYENSNGEYDKLVTLENYYCTVNPKKLKIVSVAFYRFENVVENVDFRDTTGWEYIYPESRSSYKANLICNY